MLAGVIPRRVHLYWADPTGGSAPVPSDVGENIARWSVHHPDYEVHVWAPPELADLLRDFHGLAVLDAVEACRFPSTQSDMVRLALLYEYGGFYSDPWGTKGQRDGWMQRTRASYDDPDTPHRRERQNTESVYVDGPRDPGR